MTYNVFGGTLNLAQSINPGISNEIFRCKWNDIYTVWMSRIHLYKSDQMLNSVMSLLIFNKNFRCSIVGLVACLLLVFRTDMLTVALQEAVGQPGCSD